MRFVLAAILVTLPCTSFAFDSSHKEWTAVLKKYQDERGNMHYAQLKADIKTANHSFLNYLAAIEGVSRGEFDRWTEPQKKAFLINAYNALTVKLIVDHYPVKSIKKIGGLFTKPWALEFFSLLGGEIKALDPIEHQWLRPKFKDYRIHAAVNCASVSCPPLRNEAYTGDKLDSQLDAQMRSWLSDKDRNRVSAEKLELSKIFSWYKEDFETWGGGVKAVVSKFSSQPLSTSVLNQVNISFLDYNWDLNEAH